MKRRIEGSPPLTREPKTIRLWGVNVGVPVFEDATTSTGTPMNLIALGGNGDVIDLPPAPLGRTRPVVDLPPAPLGRTRPVVDLPPAPLGRTREVIDLTGKTPPYMFGFEPSPTVFGKMPTKRFKDTIILSSEEQERDLSASVVRVMTDPDEMEEEGFRVVRRMRKDKGKTPVPSISVDGEVPDEPGEQYNVVQKSTGIPAELLEEGIWVLSNYESECRLFTLLGKPINPNLDGVLVEEASAEGAVIYKAFSADNSRILGQGSFGIAILVTDRTNPNPKTWESVVIKIEFKKRANLEINNQARNDVFKEATIGMLLDRVFYRGRVTPSVNRTMAMFQCPHLPPAIGAWKSLTDSIWPHGKSDVRNRAAADPRYEYLYTEQEYANAGTIADLVLNVPTPAHVAMQNDKDKVLIVRSIAFQAMYTLEAFRRAGFIHGDINMTNVALKEIPVGETHRRVYFFNQLGGPDESIRALDPFGQTPGNRFRLKFIDYGNSTFAYRDPKWMSYTEKMHLYAMPGKRTMHALTPVYNTPPEAFLRDSITDRNTGEMKLDTKWWISTATDLWQVCMILVTLLLGEHPLLGHRTYYEAAPMKFTDLVRFHIKNHKKHYFDFDLNKLTKDIPSHLWNVANMIGVPGTDPRTGTLNKKKQKALEDKMPLLATFRAVGAKQPGWLRNHKRLRTVFGREFGLKILQSLDWDPTERPRPGEILRKIGTSDTFQEFRDVPFVGNPLNVSMEDHNRVMYKEEKEREAWSLLTSDISYHVPISNPLKGRGPSRFIRLPKELAEAVERGGFEEEEEEILSMAPLSLAEREDVQSWSKWMF
jgi:hypothetical protein